MRHNLLTLMAYAKHKATKALKAQVLNKQIQEWAAVDVGKWFRALADNWLQTRTYPAGEYYSV
jgi:hypothetical protein